MNGIEIDFEGAPVPWFQVFGMPMGTDIVDPRPTRTMRFTCGYGQTWPDQFRRGQPVDIHFHMADRGWRLLGRVKFRRARILAIEGALTEENN